MLTITLRLVCMTTRETSVQAEQVRVRGWQILLGITGADLPPPTDTATFGGPARAKENVSELL